MIRRRWIARIALLGATIFVMLGALEFVAYRWEKKTASGPLGWTLVASRRLRLDLHGDQEHPYYLFRPNQHYEWSGTEVDINDIGLRTDNVLDPKPNDTYRIMVLGDSIVFGWEVGQYESFGSVLEEQLNGSAAGRQYEVINAGVPAWTLEAERNYLLDKGFELEPDALVLSIAIVNDITLTPIVTDENPLFGWLRDHTYSWPFLTTQSRFLLSRTNGPEAIPVLNPPAEAHRYFPLREDNPIYDKVWNYVEEMYTESRERGIPFVMILFPTAYQINSASHPDVAQRVLKQRAAEAGIQVLDMLPIYADVCENAGVGQCEGYDNLLFADVWMHPNALGHQLAAEHLFEFMQDTLP